MKKISFLENLGAILTLLVIWGMLLRAGQVQRARNWHRQIAR